MEKTNFWQKARHQLIPNVGTIIVVALMLVGYSAYAAPSVQTSISTFPYQGTLTDDSGNPITDDVDMTFRIYDVSTGGTMLWTEAHTDANAVPVENGLFQLMLGSLVPIPESVWDNTTLYLEVQIESDTPMSPRELIGSVPRAIQADIALTVPNGSITADQLENHLCCGSTNPDGTGWQPYEVGGDLKGLYIYADTSSCNFSSTPMYFTSLAGTDGHWSLVGMTNIYSRTSTSFRVFITSREPAEANQPSLAQADEKNYHIQWCGVEK